MYLQAHCCRSHSCNHTAGLILVTMCVQCTNIACLPDFMQVEQQLNRGPWFQVCILVKWCIWVQSTAMELKIMLVPDLLVGVIQRFLIMQVGLSHPKIVVVMGP